MKVGKSEKKKQRRAILREETKREIMTEKGTREMRGKGIGVEKKKK